MAKLILLEDVQELITFIYNIKFPDSEKYILQQQIKRAIISVSLNIREGNAFYDKRRMSQFKIALGSLYETDQCINISINLNIINIDIDRYYEIYWKVHNKLKKLITSIGSDVSIVSEVQD